MAVGVLDDALKGGTNSGIPPFSGKEFNNLEPAQFNTLQPFYDEEDFMVTHAQVAEVDRLKKQVEAIRNERIRANKRLVRQRNKSVKLQGLSILAHQSASELHIKVKENENQAKLRKAAAAAKYWEKRAMRLSTAEKRKIKQDKMTKLSLRRQLMKGIKHDLKQELAKKVVKGLFGMWLQERMKKAVIQKIIQERFKNHLKMHYVRGMVQKSILDRWTKHKMKESLVAVMRRDIRPILNRKAAERIKKYLQSEVTKKKKSGLTIAESEAAVLQSIEERLELIMCGPRPKMPDKPKPKRRSKKTRAKTRTRRKRRRRTLKPKPKPPPPAYPPADSGYTDPGPSAPPESSSESEPEPAPEPYTEPMAPPEEPEPAEPETHEPEETYIEDEEAEEYAEEGEEQYYEEEHGDEEYEEDEYGEDEYGEDEEYEEEEEEEPKEKAVVNNKPTLTKADLDQLLKEIDDNEMKEGGSCGVQ